MRLKDIELRDYEWMKAPPSPSAASKRIARHQREIERDQQHALEVPHELMSAHARREAGFTDEQERQLLDLEAKRATMRAVELERNNVEQRERDAEDAELLRQLLAAKTIR